MKAQWQALHMARQILLDPDSDDDKRLKACHAVNQCAGVFAKLYEAANLEERLVQVEAAMKARNGQPYSYTN